MHDLQYVIDLVRVIELPNLTHHRLNPTEHIKLKHQVDEIRKTLLSKGFIRESLSPCAIPTLLTTKKHEIWHMCIDCRAINCITIIGL